MTYLLAAILVALLLILRELRVLNALEREGREIHVRAAAMQKRNSELAERSAAIAEEYHAAWLARQAKEQSNV